jgi:cellulose synthase/poly-beta-1,6-N-acetylglucosamine synthase-like glycosyltransferase
MPPDTLLDDVVMVLPVLFRGYRTILEPDAKAFDFPTTLKSEFRRKLRTLAGLWQVCVRHPALFSSANPIRFHFVSHKAGRLLLPYLLLCLTLSAAGLPAPWRTWILGALALFYATGLLDPVVPQKFILKRITSPIRTFLAMCAASLCSVSVFFVPPQRLWKVTQVSRPAAGVEGSAADPGPPL